MNDLTVLTDTVSPLFLFEEKPFDKIGKSGRECYVYEYFLHQAMDMKNE